MNWNNTKLIKILKGDGVVVMPTDTLYGIVGRAESLDVVNRIYSVRKRDLRKPFIILIGAIDELENFSVILSEKQKRVLKQYWFVKRWSNKKLHDPISIILDCSNPALEYLHRGTKTLAFRLPAIQSLRNLLFKVGPLVAPSANLEAMPPGETILEAKKYFGNTVDLYFDGGRIVGKASKIIRLHKDGSISVVRH